MRFKCYISCLVVLLLGFFSSWAEAQEWTGTITATNLDVSGVSQVLTFGADASATDGYDVAFDVPAPPLPSPPIDLEATLKIAHMFFARLTTDIKEKADTNEWELSVASDTGSIELTWDLSGVPTSKSVSLISGDTTVNMRSETSLELAQGSHTLTLTAATSPDLEVLKTVDNPTPDEGDTIVYTVTATNTAAVAATGIEVTDQLPSGVTYVSDTPSQGTYNSGTGVWSVGDLNDASATLTITATVNSGTAGSTITNTATRTAMTPDDPNSANDSDSAAITVKGADLEVSKEVDNPTPDVGDTIVYTVTVSNNGPDDASNVAITDQLPTGVTYVSDDSGGSYNSSAGVWTVSSLTNGASATLTITATVDSGIDTFTITNAASVTAADQADSVSDNNSDSAVIQVKNADLAVTKTVDNSSPDDGDSIIYTVTVTNNGPDDAANVALTDLLPTGVTYVSDDSGGSYNSGTGVWMVGALANGASATLKITATVAWPAEVFTITNAASVTAADQADPDSTNNSDSADINKFRSDLAVDKTVDNATPNEDATIVYTIAVTNNGPDDATNVAITDLLSAGVTYVSDDSGSYNSSTGVWTAGSVANGASAILKITATVDSGTGGTIIPNIASVTAADQPDPVSTNNSDSADITVQLADLAVGKTVDNATPNEDATIVYTISVTNNGPDAATNVAITDLLPTGVTYVSDDSGSYNSGTGVWTAGSVANGASATLRITAAVDSGTGGSTIPNTASVTADQADPVSTNNSDSADITVQLADLAVGKTVDNATPNEDATIVYTITVTNNGPDAATNVAITDLLPTGMTYVSADSGSYNSGTGVWTVGSLVNGATAALKVTATVDSGIGGTTIPNTASVTADQADPVSTNNSDSADITVQLADVAVSKTVDTPFPSEGDTITYTVTLTNNGPDAATNVAITDLLPTGVTYVSDDSGSYNSGTGVWTAGNLANGASVTLKITATVDVGSGIPTITNTASVTAMDQADPDSSNNSDSVDMVAAVDLEVAKTVDKATPNEGANIAYTVTVTNNGPGSASNVEITDLLPTGVTYASDTPSQGSYVSSTGGWTAGNLANGASATLTITAIVDAGTGGTTIGNTASVTAVDQADQIADNNSDSASITVQLADVAVTKTVDNATPNVGNTITYTVTVTNSGPDGATNVAITDLLSTGVTYASDTPSQGSYVSGTGVWTVGSLANGASATLIITATVDSGTGGTIMGNTASVTAVDQADPVATNNSDSASVTVQSADLAVSKTVDSPTPEEGSTITYTVTVTNNGPDAATNAAITDLLPSGVTYASDTPSQGSYVGATGVWTVVSLANGASATLTITATVDSDTAGSTILNTASVTAVDQADPVATNDSDSASITVLAITKAVDNPAPNEGDTITYTVSVTNSGSASAVGIVITQVVPEGLTYVSSSADGTYDNESRTVTWTLDSVPEGTTDLSMTVTIDSGTGGTTITIPGGPPITVQSADLAVSKTADDATPEEGNTVTYTVTVTNNGPDDATGIAITDQLPTGVTYVSDTPSQGSYVRSSAGVLSHSDTGVWSVGNLTNGTSATLTITATVDLGTAGTTILNTASVTAVDQADLDISNNSDSADIAVQLADVGVSVTVDNSSPSESDTLTYTVTVTNNGPDPATGTEVTDQLPAGVTYVSDTPSQGSYVSSTGVWAVGNLANGASTTLIITVTVDLGTGDSIISNTASVANVDQTDPDGSNNTSSATISVLLRLRLVSASYDVLNTTLILVFNNPINPARTDFDGIGMEVENSGKWDFALSNARGLYAETNPDDARIVIIDITRDHVTTVNLAVALLVSEQRVDLLLRRGAFTEVTGGLSREVAGTDNIRIQRIPPAGDVSGNGKVTSYDAALILRVSVGEPETIFPVHDAASKVSALLASYGYESDVMMSIADTSGNGELSAYDAALALRRAVGLPNPAPAFSGSSRIGKLSVDSYDDERLDISINLDDVRGIYSADIVMTYDPQVLTLADVSRTSSTSEWLKEDSRLKTQDSRLLALGDPGSGEIIISLAGAYQPAADGSLVDLSFHVNRHTSLSLGDAISKLDITQFELNGGMVKATIENLPKAFALLQNYPNPFNPETWIPYQLSEPTDVAIHIYNVRGQMVRRLELGYRMPGYYTDRSRAAHWDGRNEVGEEVASGVYFYQLQAGRDVSTRKMIVLR